MNGEIDIVTLLFLILAVVIFLKLRSVLGRKTGDEHSRYDQRTPSDSNPAANGAAGGKVVSLPRRGGDDGESMETAEASYEAQEARIRKSIKDGKVADGLIEVYRADRGFRPDDFVQGAKSAYEMTVSAFAEGNRKVLKGLLSSDVYEGFAGAITAREERGEKVDQNFVGISKADILEAGIKSNTAEVTVKFVSELISATFDKAGNIIAGDPDSLTDVTDVWTFARDVNARDPNWKLIATQAA